MNDTEVDLANQIELLEERLRRRELYSDAATLPAAAIVGAAYVAQRLEKRLRAEPLIRNQSR